MKKISVIIIGGGGRGTIYSRHLQTIMEKAEVTAIAEPREYFRNRIADMHNIPLATNLASAELMIKALDRGDLEWREIYKD